MIHCREHDQDVTGYKITNEYAEIDGKLVRSYEEIGFPCGCSFPFAQITSETVVDQDVTPDGTRIIELTILDVTGNPVMSWMETRETADTF